MYTRTIEGLPSLDLKTGSNKTSLRRQVSKSFNPEGWEAFEKEGVFRIDPFPFPERGLIAAWKREVLEEAGIPLGKYENIKKYPGNLKERKPRASWLWNGSDEIGASTNPGLAIQNLGRRQTQETAVHFERNQGLTTRGMTLGWAHPC